jgi:hypothetical protein
VSEQLTWRVLDEAGEATTAANRPAFLPQTLASWAQTFFWPYNLPQERYNFMKPVPKKEIPVYRRKRQQAAPEDGLRYSTEATH